MPDKIPVETTPANKRPVDVFRVDATQPDAIAFHRAPRHGDLFTVDIDRLSGRGLGLADIEATIASDRQARRFRLVVRGAIPGDRVEAEVRRRRRGDLEAGLVRVLTPSPHRIEPRCPHAASPGRSGPACGGCALQAMGYEQQLAQKSARIASLLASVGVAQERIRPIVPVRDNEPWHYRNKMEFSFASDRSGKLTLGLFPAGYRYEVVDLQTCLLESPEAVELIRLVREWCRDQGLGAFDLRRDKGFLRTLTVREGKRTGERLVELTTAPRAEVVTSVGPRPAAEVVEAFAQWLWSQPVALSSLVWTRHVAVRGQRTRIETDLLRGSPMLRETMNLGEGHTLEFEIAPRAFFQPNTFQAEVLYRQVRAFTQLGLGGEALVLDLYCGTGTIGLSLAPFAKAVLGVELNADAVENARRNAAANQIENAVFVAGDAAQVLATIFEDREGTPGGESASLAIPPAALALGDEMRRAAERLVVVVDPPRSGLGEKACAILSKLSHRRMVYVSCNPEALARDLVLLAGAGFVLEAAQPVDMFPHTAHVEVVTLLTR